jgi:hypothetical protein
MPRSVAGLYTLPGAVNPVVSNDLITANWANTTLNDAATVLTASLDRSGNGNMLSQLKGVDGTAGAPAFTFTTQTNLGWSRTAADTLLGSVAGVAAVTVTPGTITFGVTAVAAALVITPTAATFNAAVFPTFAGVPTAGSHLINKTFGDANYLTLTLAKGNWNLIKEVATSAVATIDFANGTGGVVLDSTYEEYLFQYVNVTASVTGEFLASRFSTDAGATYVATANYGYSNLGSQLSAAGWTSQGLSNNAATMLLVSGAVTTGAGYKGLSGESILYSPSTAGWQQMTSSTVSHVGALNATRVVGHGNLNVNQDTDGIRFLWQGGSNFVAGGFIRMYGRRKS